MTALNQDRNTQTKDGQLVALLVGAGAKIYGGGLVAVNAAGFAVPGAADATLVSIGRADVSVDNTAGADGAQTVTVVRGKLIKLGNSSVDLVTQASVGRTCYVVDDQTVAATHAGNTRPMAGKVFGIEADGVWVWID